VSDMNDLLTLLTGLETYLKADNDLSYIETIVPGDYDIDFPDFDTYAVMLDPESIQIGLRSIKRAQEKSSLSVICIVRNYDPVLSLTGAGYNEETEVQETGIIKMTYDVYYSIQAFLEANKGTLDVDCTEVEEPISLKNAKKERAGFYREVVIPLNIKFKEDKIRRL
jgi:hypothetical protein